MSAPARVGRAWRRLEPDQRLAALAAVLLLLSMLLPWYEVSTSFAIGNTPRTEHDARTAFGVYSFVEAAIFLVAVGVLALLFARGERKAFHLPGGDGNVILAGGLWVMFLVFYRQLDKPNIRGSGASSVTVGVGWGIFVAFLLGALLAYAGFRIRAAHIAEPAADDVPPMPSRPPEPPPEARAGAGGEAAGAPTTRPAARSRRAGHVDVAATDQLSFDDPPAPPDGDDEDPATAVAWEEPRVTRRRRRDPGEVFERPADPDDPTEFRPGRRR